MMAREVLNIAIVLVVTFLSRAKSNHFFQGDKLRMSLTSRSKPHQNRIKEEQTEQDMLVMSN